MATKEFLQERISKAQEQITKKQNLITKMEDRIAKNRIKLQKLGFTEEQIEVGIDNPWNIPDDHPECEKGYNLCYSIGTAMESITNAKKALPELQEKLQKYEADLKTVTAEDNRIGQIPDILLQYKDTLVKAFDADDFERQNFLAEEHKKLHYDEFFRKYKGTDYNLIWMSEEEIHKSNTKTADALIRNLWTRVKDICTDVTAIDLHLENGNQWEGICINGTVKGSTGIATVKSIYAGGWNIQKLHIRTLVQEWK